MNSPEAALFALALAKPLVKRAAFLDAMCEDDPALRARLEALLAAHEQPEPLVATQADTARPTIKLDLADAPDEAVGQTLGRYKLLERVGEGGCGVVYVAEQKEPVRRKVALKVIKLGMDTKQVVARFEAERQALAMMDHPNIAKVLDAGTTDVGRPFFVMELVRGIKITDYCDQANLTTKERLDLFIKVCQAIQHAHQKGIIHRDIKPSNILVTLHDGVPVPKVIDFGIAKATEGRLTDATVYTQLHQFIGTPAYMSPEQAEMSGLDIDTRSDIYSLGVLLYELLAGSTPFDPKELMASGIDAMRKTIREKEPQRPSTRLATLGADQLTTTARRRSADTSKLLHQLKGDLDWIVMKCLEKDRQRRYETANGLAADLKRHLNNEPVVARPPSATYRFQKAFRRNKLVFASATAIAASLVIGIAASVWQAVRATHAKQDAEVARKGEKTQRLQAQQKQVEAEAERERADAQAGKALASQQHSRRLLYAADMNLAQQSLKLNNLGRARRLLEQHRPRPGEEDLRGWEWRYLWQLTRNNALVTLTNRPTRGFDVSFSPDGTRLAVGWFDGRVELWDVPNRRLVRTLTDSGLQGHVAFSTVRNLLAATSRRGVVTLYDLDSGQESTLWRAPQERNWRVQELSFSQDGSRLVIYAKSGPLQARDAAWVVNVSSFQIENYQPTASTGGGAFMGAARLSSDHQRLYLPRSDISRFSIVCLELATKKELWQTESQRDLLSALTLSPDGRILVSGSGYEDPTIRVWDAATGRLLVRLDGHTGWVGKLAFTKDGRRLISAAADQTIRVWDTSTWTETQALRGHSDEVHGMAISESAHLIASAGKDGNIMLWQDGGTSATDGYRRLPENLRNGQVESLDHSRVLLLPRDLPPEVMDLKADSAPLPLTQLGPSTNIVGFFGTNLLCRWNGTNQIVIQEWRGEKFIPRGAITVDSGVRPNRIILNPARPFAAWAPGTNSTSIYLVNFASPGRRVELKSEVAGLAPWRFSEDGKQLLTGKLTGNPQRIWNSLGIWNVETGQIMASINERARDAIFAAGGRVLVTAIPNREGYEIAFYDLSQPDQAPRRFSGRHAFNELAVSPKGGLVASCDEGGKVKLFDPTKGELIETIDAHRNSVMGIEFSADGRRLISTSGGRDAVKLWDVGTRQELLTLSGVGSILLQAKWTADADVILAGAPWQAWRAPSWEEIDAAEAKDPPSTAYDATGKAESKQP